MEQGYSVFLCGQSSRSVMGSFTEWQVMHFKITFDCTSERIMSDICLFVYKSVYNWDVCYKQYAKLSCMDSCLYFRS